MIRSYVAELMRAACCRTSFGSMRPLLVPLVSGSIRDIRSFTAGRHVHWIAADAVAAAALLVLLTGHAAAQRPQFGVPGWLAVTASAVTALSVAVRRVRPTAVFAVALASGALAAASGVSGNPAVTVALTLYTVAVSQPPRRSATALTAALILTLPAEALAGLAGQPPQPRLVLDYLMTATAVIIGAVWAIGAMQRRYAAYSAEERDRRAVVGERLRIARELHDVISHAVTLITAKAAVTNYLIDSRPEEARSALAIIEATGRETLAEMRRLLGVLRAGDSPAAAGSGGKAPAGPPSARAPAPGLAGIRTLAAQASAAGVQTSVDIRGEAELPEPMALPVYRIVQEALTNVIKHAGPARCDVQIEITGGQVAVGVTDDGHPRPITPGRADGHGLIGMRERVSLYGGEFTAGPRPGGGFEVCVRLPVSPVGGTAAAGQERPA